MIVSAHFLATETRPCGYFDDGRVSTMDYYGYDSLRNMRYDGSTPSQYRKTRFDLMRKGMLGDAFSAAIVSCEPCRACVPLRINTFEFEITSRQQKIMDNFVNGDRESFWTKPISAPPLFALYKKYLSQRFPNSPMLDEDIHDFYSSLHAKSEMMLLTNKDDRLLGFASIDRFDKECSLDYVTYDPDFSDLRLGNVAFLATVKWAQENLIPHVYIGPINESKSLRYKRYYSGLETFDGEKWVHYDPKKHNTSPNYAAIKKRFLALHQ